MTIEPLSEIRWLNVEYYRYLFAKADDPNWTNWYRRLLCRYQGHPKGPIWNSQGLEPNMKCRGCGDQIG